MKYEYPRGRRASALAPYDPPARSLDAVPPDAMRERGLRAYRIDLLRETPERVGPLLARYARVVAGLDDGRSTWRELRALNQLGVTRGTRQVL